MSRPLRIAMFVGAFPEISETFILRQITGLLDLGHSVDIYSEIRSQVRPQIHSEIEKYHLFDRTTYINMPATSGVWELSVWPLTGETWPPGEESPIQNWRRVWNALPRLARCLTKSPQLTRQVLSQKEYGYQAASLSALYRLAALCSVSKRYDVVHAHFGPVGNNFRFARELWRAPLLVSFHGYDFTTVPRKQGPEVYKKLFSIADLVTVNSDYMGQKLQPLGCPPDKIRKLSYGIDLEKFSFRPRTLEDGQPVRIVTTARLVEKKGIEYVIRALAQVKLKHPNLHYDIIGDGPLREPLQQLAREQSVEGIVQFHGALNSAAIRALLDQAHLFVLASVTAQDGDQEGTPVSLLEAQAAGLPVISTRHSGIPEIVPDGESGWLAPERDTDVLAGRLNDLIEHPECWAAFGSRGRNFVEAGFTTTKCLNALLDIYAELDEKYSARG
ncbi:MAG: colanic acid/amylovoran biosynthesis glycosyltransferase [Verrucomicrobiota bacterium]|jgi:colanic acid/amylovoran biosynthesis glycosyltransferase